MSATLLQKMIKLWQPSTIISQIFPFNYNLFAMRIEHLQLGATGDFWASPLQRQPHIYLIKSYHLWEALQLSAHLSLDDIQMLDSGKYFSLTSLLGVCSRPTLPSGMTAKCCELFVEWTDGTIADEFTMTCWMLFYVCGCEMISASAVCFRLSCSSPSGHFYS